MFENDMLANVLFVDLSQKRFWTEKRRDLFERYLGGAGVATQLLHEQCPQGCDPLGPENPIIFAVGPLTSLFPLASKDRGHVQVASHWQPGRKSLWWTECRIHSIGGIWSYCHKRSQRHPGVPGYSW